MSDDARLEELLSQWQAEKAQGRDLPALAAPASRRAVSQPSNSLFGLEPEGSRFSVPPFQFPPSTVPVPFSVQLAVSCEIRAMRNVAHSPVK
jgi:hypothetical protein